MEIRQLIKAKISGLIIPSRTIIQSITDHEFIDYHAKNLLPIIQKQAKAATEDIFATGRFPNNEPTRSS